MFLVLLHRSMKILKTMKTITKSLLAFLVIFMLSSGTLREVEGVEFKEKITIEGKELVLNGAGLREKYFLDLYVAGLYLESKTSNANQIINDDKSMVLKIHIVSELITSEKMVEAVDEGFSNSAPDKVKELAPQIKQFKDVFLKEAIKEDDVYDIISIPGKGVMVKKNGNLEVTISGLDFKKGLFGIWLCDEPADEDLKEGLLGLDD